MSGYRLESGLVYERMTVPMSSSDDPTLPLHSFPGTLLPGSSLPHMGQPLSSHHDIAADIHHHYTHYTGVRLAGNKKPGVLRSVREVG